MAVFILEHFHSASTSSWLHTAQQHMPFDKEMKAKILTEPLWGSVKTSAKDHNIPCKIIVLDTIFFLDPGCPPQHFHPRERRNPCFL